MSAGYEPKSCPGGHGGFTLLEMMIVVAILGILALGLVPLNDLATQRARESDLRTGLRQMRGALDAYRRAVDEGRIERKADESGYPRRLSDLVTGVPDAKSPDRRPIYFLRRLPRDPFAEPGLPPEDTWGRRSYASPPDRPAEGRDVFDVYSRSERIGLNGVPYRDW
ncbi:MAG: type II secretion system protein [Betaproteobacteria bacterium]